MVKYKYKERGRASSKTQKRKGNAMMYETLKEKFWENHKNIKRKTTQAGELEAQKEQLWFVQNELAKLSDEDLNDTFGGYADLVRRWIKAEIVTNKFGKHLYVKLG